MNGGCWRDSISCDGDSLIVPCDITVCCLSRYKVCADSVGNLSVVQMSATANHDCDSTNPYCYPVCGDDTTGMIMGGPGLSGIHISTPPDQAIRRGELEIPTVPAHGRISEKAVVPERKPLTRNR